MIKPTCISQLPVNNDNPPVVPFPLKEKIVEMQVTMLETSHAFTVRIASLNTPSLQLIAAVQVTGLEPGH